MPWRENFNQQSLPNRRFKKQKERVYDDEMDSMKKSAPNIQSNRANPVPFVQMSNFSEDDNQVVSNQQLNHSFIGSMNNSFVPPQVLKVNHFKVYHNSMQSTQNPLGTKSK